MLCDDEPNMLADVLPRLAARYPQAQVAACLSGEELLAADAADIILLDVQMPGISGMETAKRLRERGSRAIIIFLTGREDAVFDAFEYEAFRYLLKPVSEEALFAAVDAAAEKYEASQAQNATEEAFTVSSFGMHIRVRPSEIIYAEIDNRQLCLHLSDREVVYYGKMADLEKLVGDGFFRTHRSFLINLAYVSGYSANEVTLKKGSVYLSKRNYPAFVKAYMAYLKGERGGNGLHE